MKKGPSTPYGRTCRALRLLGTRNPACKGVLFYSYGGAENVAPTSLSYEGTKTVDGQETPVNEYYYKAVQSVADYIAAQKAGYAEWSAQGTSGRLD